MIDWTLILEWFIKAAISCFVLLTGFAYMTFAERKVAALLQVRIGPNRAGPGGFFQPVADGIKLIFKEEFIPGGADKVIFMIAPIITVIPALIILGVVPWGPTVTLFGRKILLGITDLNVGILYILSVASIAVYGIVLAGWSSNNKYAMLGGLRSTAQMVSYELSLGLAIVGPLLLAGSMSLGDIVNAQSKLPFILLQPVAALVFYVAALAEVNRAPFDMPEAEQELTAGYHTEYSGMKFALFFMAEYIKMIGVSAIFTTLFLGGWRGPFADLGAPQLPAAFPEPLVQFVGGLDLGLLGLIYFWAKVAASLFFMIWLRSTHPRLRYDRLMALGWKVMLPLALANVMVTAAALVSPVAFWIIIGVLVVVVAAYLAGRVGLAVRGT
ncbi:MAG: NADH-quinone oxidoreductase subunit NuoH [Chloroflexi bacterium]|nr:NADH-quinone oxidoreductase subunit NuoH [Chloroflexota bacterium]